MTDILERLRKAESLTRGPLYSLSVEAAEEIEKLRLELAFSRQINAMLRRLGDQIELGPEED